MGGVYRTVGVHLVCRRLNGLKSVAQVRVNPHCTGQEAARVLTGATFLQTQSRLF